MPASDIRLKDSKGSFSPFQAPINTYQYYNLANLPMRTQEGRVPLIPPDPAPHQELQLSEHRKIATFKLWKEDENKKLQDLLEAYGKTVFIVEQEFQYVPEQENWVVLLMWAEPDWNAPANPSNIETSEKPADFGSKAVVYE